MMGTIRTFDPELRKEIYNDILKIAEGKSLIEATNGNFAEITRRTGAEDFWKISARPQAQT